MTNLLRKQNGLDRGVCGGADEDINAYVISDSGQFVRDRIANDEQTGKRRFRYPRRNESQQQGRPNENIPGFRIHRFDHHHE